MEERCKEMRVVDGDGQLGQDILEGQLGLLEANGGGGGVSAKTNSKAGDRRGKGGKGVKG